MNCFADVLYRRLELAQFAEHLDNVDHNRLVGTKKPDFLRLLGYCSRKLCRRHGFYRRSWLNVASAQALAQWMPLLGELDWFYRRLADDESRSLLVEIVAYRIMGPRAVRLPLSNKAYAQKVEELFKLGDERDQIDIGFMGWKLSRFNLQPIGYPMTLYIRNAMTNFVVEQYAHHSAGVAVESGDTVLEGGGCYGDTALYFAHKAGSAGAVHVFEFVPSNLTVLRRNCHLNPDLENRIKVAEYALWNQSGLPVYVSDRGPASSVSDTPRPGFDIRSETVTIDDYVGRTKIKRVDFIKLDIEGAEENALVGAEKTIIGQRPKLAVCLYHSPKDFVRLPRLLDKYVPEYKFFLKHATMHEEETVLFAKV